MAMSTRASGAEAVMEATAAPRVPRAAGGEPADATHCHGLRNNRLGKTIFENL